MATITGLVQSSIFQEERKQARTARLTRSHFAKFFNVCPSDERTTCSDEYRGFNASVLRDLIESLGNTFGYAWTKRVHGRIVDRDNGDAIFSCKLNEIGHRSSCGIHREMGIIQMQEGSHGVKLT
jgi:hypothetical protein